MHNLFNDFLYKIFKYTNGKQKSCEVTKAFPSSSSQLLTQLYFAVT
ncbi:hypothetical protein CBDKU1_08090 [Clostridium butyricum DKU-01]|nr:hypothetical protein CBDKU1_08090 [Clostridium butyricum DKU-01]